MDAHLKDFIANLLGSKIKKVSALSGGDITKSYCLFAQTERFFCKTHSGHNAKSMFEVEKQGLETLAATKTIGIPGVLGCSSFNKRALLVLEYVEGKSPNEKDFERLGNALGQLHKHSSNSFGWKNDNFIGSLPQSNKSHKDWVSFYVKERLWPQLVRAQENKLLSPPEIPSLKNILSACKPLFGNITPSLLHGDLWSGNYIIASDGRPYLIDPAIYFGHREVDMAMTRLFGGFSPSFYSAHSQHFEVNPFEKEHNDIYQLFYLLVHLNLFGRSYHESVKTLLNRYFF